MQNPDNRKLLAILATASTIAMTNTGCRAIGDIFKAGVWVGVVVVVAILALIGGLVAIVRR